MSTVEKLSIALTPEFAADVREAVAGGEYASTSEVIRDALRVWGQARKHRRAVIEELQLLWRDGVDSGRKAGQLDAREIKRRGRARLAGDDPADR